MLTLRYAEFRHLRYVMRSFSLPIFVYVNGQIGEILAIFCFFYLYPFLSNSPTGQTAHHNFTLNGSNDADSRLWLILQPI